MQGIEIPIGAPLGQLDKDLKNATNKISNFADTTLGKFAILNKTKFTFGQNFISEADKLAGKGKGLGDNLSGPLVKGSNQAAFALQNLGRVAQDAPFGFIGIQNNLNPLLESFQRLKAETGGTGSALKALGQTLIGPAGLGIALSVVSAGILFYQQYQQRANKEVATAKKVTDEYINSLGQVQQAQLKGAQNAQNELVTLKLLYSQYQNATLPLEQRKDAYKEIQKLYPAYFGNMAFEATATDKTKNAYNSLTDSILASARARAAADLIAKNSTRQLENEQKVVDLTKQIQDERTKQIKLQSAVESQNLLAKQEANILTSKQAQIVNQYLKAGAKEAELTKLKNNLLTDTNLLTEKNLLLEKAVNAETLKGAKISGNVGGDAMQKAKGKSVKDDAKKRAADLSKEGNAFAVKMLKSLQDFQINATNEAAKRKSLLNVIDEDELNLAVRQAEKSAKEIVDKFAPISVPLLTPFQKLNLYIKETIIPQLSSSFKTFFDDLLMNGKLSFDALGQAIKNTFLSVLSSEATKGVLSLLTGGDKKEGGKGGGLLGVVGGLLKIGGKKAVGGAVASGGGAAALGGGTAATGGALLPILAGVAAVAGIASLFKKKPKQAPLPQASSTISTSAAGSAQDFGGGRVVFEISGTNLVGVLNRAGAKLQRFG
jgi:hypothetical protein